MEEVKDLKSVVGNHAGIPFTDEDSDSMQKSMKFLIDLLKEDDVTGALKDIEAKKPVSMQKIIRDELVLWIDCNDAEEVSKKIANNLRSLFIGGTKYED